MASETNDDSATLINPHSSDSTKNSSDILLSKNKKRKDQMVFVGAEMEGYQKVGGVSTVIKDYQIFDNPIIIPYYNGKLEYTSFGVPTGNVSVVTKPDGTPIFTPYDLDLNSLNFVLKNEKRYKELELIASKTMQWGDRPSVPIALYKVKNTVPEHYMVYTEMTAKMRKPYQELRKHPAYSSLNSVLNFIKPASWEGTAYGQFGKAFVELLPEIKNFYPETIVCNDSQTAYVIEYMAKKNLAGDEYYQNMKPTYVKHNVGIGYNGEISNRDMFVNLGASLEDIQSVENDPEYIEAMRNNQDDLYFKKFVEKTLTPDGTANATKLVLNYREQGFVGADTTVSEFYGDAITSNPEINPQLFPIEKALRAQGKGGGILNPLNDPSVDPYKPLPAFLKTFNIKTTAKLKNGKFIDFSPIKPYIKGASYDEMMQIKNENKRNLLERFSNQYSYFQDKGAIYTGGENRKVEVYGLIDKKWIEKIDNGEKVTLFTSWGRGDFQKGHDIVMEAFARHAKTPCGANSLLILGGQLEDGHSTAKELKDKANAMLRDKDLQGRLIFINGFAPGYAMATAADACVFASRFAPCELTDFEAMKYFSTPIVTNTQGLAQKNFDPRIASEKPRATSYKTIHEFYMNREKLMEVSSSFKDDYEQLLNKERTIQKLLGLKGDKLEETVIKNVDSSQAYMNLLRYARDGVLIEEFTDALNAKATEERQISELLYENLQKVKTSWKENGAFRPDGKSSYEAYQELHFLPNPQPAKEDIFVHPVDILPKSFCEIEETLSLDTYLTKKKSLHY